MVLTLWAGAFSPSARAQDVAAAAQAYEAGTHAQLAGNYAEAARLFELAYAAAPSPEALRSAIRNRREAGDHARAATLSLEAITTYPGSRATRDLAQEVLDAQQPLLAQLQVACSAPCVLLIDGAVESAREERVWRVFVRPGSHEVGARFTTGPAESQVVQVEAGARASLDFEAPAAAVVPDVPERVEAPVSPPGEPTPTPTDSQGMAPGLFWASASVAAVMVGVTVWSVADTFSANRAYEAAPTRAGYVDGRSRRTRMFAFVGTSAALVAGTAVIGALTDFGGAEDEPAQATLRPDVWASPDGAGFQLSGEF